MDPSWARLGGARSVQSLCNGQRTVKTIKKPDGSVVTETTERYASPDWRAAAWWLERQFPEEFSTVERRGNSGSDGGPIDVGLTLGELYRRDAAARALGLELADRTIESGALEGRGPPGKSRHLCAPPEGRIADRQGISLRRAPPAMASGLAHELA